MPPEVRWPSRQLIWTAEVSGRAMLAESEANLRVLVDRIGL